MTDLQFYLSVGLPIALNLTAITISFLALNKRIEDMRDVLRAETKDEFATLRGELKGEIASLRLEVKTDLIRMDTKLDAILNLVAG
jgi:flagellar motor switch protein FliM